MMKILMLILAITIAVGSSAMAQNNDEGRARAERAERAERGERGERGDSDARAAFREKVGALVEAGKISREEAGDLYRTAFQE
ncbi:hypothetical protein N8677_00380, partial [Verrucomicrobia bacterium]|nr:hypothetical protein [Verrucomicrobiota bacterium]